MKEKKPLILLLNIEMNSKKDKKSFLTSFFRVPEELYNYSTYLLLTLCLSDCVLLINCTICVKWLVTWYCIFWTRITTRISTRRSRTHDPPASPASKQAGRPGLRRLRLLFEAKKIRATFQYVVPKMWFKFRSLLLLCTTTTIHSSRHKNNIS